MKLGVFLLLSIMLTGISMISFADNFEPLPHCYKPNKPLWMASSYYKKRYNNDAEQYQRCMKSFIKSQEIAAEIHTLAAQKALETWNDFANNKSAKKIEAPNNKRFKKSNARQN